MTLTHSKRGTHDAIEMQRRVAQVIGRQKQRSGPEKLRPGTAPPALFLIRGGKTPESPSGPVAARFGAIQPATKPVRRTDQVKHMGKLIPFTPKEQQEKERLLGFMAAMGPLVWLGHVLVGWMRGR